MDNNSGVNEQQSEFEVRKGKLVALAQDGKIPFKDKFARTHTIEQARTLPMESEVSVAGRLISRRVMGKLIFADIYSVEARIQICISKGEAPDAFATFKEFTDTADYVGVTGKLFTTGTGEITVKATDLVLLSKALRGLPEKFHGITDTDTKYRQRFLDLISNSETRDAIKIRLKTIAAIRKFLTQHDFIEIETPIIQNIACGANARPFVTKHNALNKDYFLRIAPELYLKQVIASGFDRVFELGKNFRNEGMDAQHLQEFTMLEWYASYWDFRDNIAFLSKLLQTVIFEVKGSYIVEYEGKEFDFSSFAEIDYTKEVSALFGEDILEIDDLAAFKARILKKGLIPKDELDRLHSLTAVVDFVFKKRLRPTIIQPTFTVNYPSYMVPLARRNDNNPKLLDMFQLLVNGSEFSKAYSELVNPVTQREAFEEQMSARAAGDDEAMEIDEG
ncbi:MAG: lysine--tRNA ligase, partial [Christensenellaceae bacterium]|nr:lysine--tRNA ligase [Christensenellaceae bacterium]